MLMPDVTMLLSDPTIGAQTFTVTRKTGAWQSGRFVLGTPTTFTAKGIMQPAGQESLRMFPEGERREGQIVVYTKTTLYLTDGDEVSDEIAWRGETYKILRLDRWQDHGFNIAYAQKE